MIIYLLFSQTSPPNGGSGSGNYYTEDLSKSLFSFEPHLLDLIPVPLGLVLYPTRFSAIPHVSVFMSDL